MQLDFSQYMLKELLECNCCIFTWLHLAHRYYGLLWIMYLWCSLWNLFICRFGMQRWFHGTMPLESLENIFNWLMKYTENIFTWCHVALRYPGKYPYAKFLSKLFHILIKFHCKNQWKYSSKCIWLQLVGYNEYTIMYSGTGFLWKYLRNKSLYNL